MRRLAVNALGILLAVGLGSARTAAAQGVPLSIEEMPLAQYGAVKSGGTVTPVYEGWYPNPDGSYTIYFGYYNRNTEEVVRIPVGPDNRVDGIAGGPDQGQPTRFEPGRHWGVFAVRVPRDVGDPSVVWRLRLRGQTFEIPGELREEWSVPAVTGDAMGNLPPRISFEDGGPEGFGPAGVSTGPRAAEAGRPVSVSVLASDDGTATSGRPGAEAGPVTLTWFVHRGRGGVTFDAPSGTVPNSGGRFETEVTFAEPGEYVLRVRANDDSGVAPAGHEQCCWTNGYIAFSVSR